MWMNTASPSRSVTLYIFSPACRSASVISVPASRQGFLHAGFVFSLPAAWNTLTASTMTPRVAKVLIFSMPSRLRLFWVTYFPIGVWL